MTLANIIQTVPVIAMLAILMLSMGLGMNTVIFTVFYTHFTYYQEYLYRHKWRRHEH